MNRTKNFLLLMAGLSLISPLLTGCQEKQQTMSDQEKADFKGGPMPEEARQKMQERMKAAQQGNAKAPAGSH